MTTLITVYNSSGCVGRCDARCHFASKPHCSCICGGRYHQKGKMAPMELQRDIARGIGFDIASFAAEHGLAAEELRIEIDGQTSLFEEAGRPAGGDVRRGDGVGPAEGETDDEARPGSPGGAAGDGLAGVAENDPCYGPLT